MLKTSASRTCSKTLTPLTPLTPLTGQGVKGVKGVKGLEAPALLRTLRAAGFELFVEAEQLRWRGPAGVLADSTIAALREHKAELLLLLEAQAAGVAPVEAEATPEVAPDPEPQVLAGPAPAVELASVHVGALLGAAPAPLPPVVEILRPDLREPLGLAPLDDDPPEAPPLPGCQWVRDLGLWQRSGGCIPTSATRPAGRRYQVFRDVARARLH